MKLYQVENYPELFNYHTDKWETIGFAKDVFSHSDRESIEYSEEINGETDKDQKKRIDFLMAELLERLHWVYYHATGWFSSRVDEESKDRLENKLLEEIESLSELIREEQWIVIDDMDESEKLLSNPKSPENNITV